MEFLESLPASCPPNDAKFDELTGVWRFAASENSSKEEFASHAQLGKTKPDKVDACRWSSCSLFEEKAMRNMAKTPRFRDMFRVKLDIPAASGMHVNKKGHIDFWMLSTFDPCTAIVEVEKP